MASPDQARATTHLVPSSSPTELSAVSRAQEEAGSVDERALEMTSHFASSHSQRTRTPRQNGWSPTRRKDESGDRTHHNKKQAPTCAYPPEDACLSNVVTSESLLAYLSAEELQHLNISPSELRLLWSASREPPVTKASLSELDLHRIIYDAKLRHDLNFEREVAFRPNLAGQRGEQKILLAGEYWKALTIELLIDLARRRRRKLSSESVSPWQLDQCCLKSVPWRLPQMFAAIRDILKTLVPDSESSVVDQRLDIDLLTQQLYSGVCDLMALSEWLQVLLLGSCSPLRDESVSSTVAMIQDGVKGDDVLLLVDGLRSIFGILETMKLDVANHQIRYLRLLMIDDSVQFEQTHFLRRIASGFPVSEAYDWFGYAAQDGSQEPVSPKTRLVVFTRAMVDVIITDRASSYPTLVHDADRLRGLHHDFRKCILQEICNDAFKRALLLVGYVYRPPLESYKHLQRRIDILSESCYSISNIVLDAETIAMEIIREVYRVCNFNNLPDLQLLGNTERYLNEAWNPDSNMYQLLEDFLCDDLEDMMDEELDLISNLSPLQILNHYNPDTSFLEVRSEPDPLRTIAQRLAHITVLHWRIWAPILYDQPLNQASLFIHPTINSENIQRNAVQNTGTAHTPEESPRRPHSEPTKRPETQENAHSEADPPPMWASNEEHWAGNSNDGLKGDSSSSTGSGAV